MTQLTLPQEAGVPTLFVAVQSLPKGALVEKQLLSHTGRCLVADDDADEYDEPSLQFRVPVRDKGKMCLVKCGWY